MIGFLGAGQLGEPMVLRLLDAGHQVCVYARRPAVSDRLRAHGAVSASSIADLAANSDILISCLFSDEQVRETGLGPGGFVANAKSDAIVVSHTTGTPATLSELSESASSPLTIVDAPVSGSAVDIANGDLTVLIGGPDDVVETVRPVLAAYSDPIIHTGDVGSALKVKLVNNTLFAANAQLVSAAITVGERLGISSDILLEALTASSGDSYAMTCARRSGIDFFVETAGPFLRKDVAAAVAAADESAVDLGLLLTTIESGPIALTAGR